MTNAERQKRYRDRKRGGPPKGRWAGHVSAAKRAATYGSSRSMVFMARWICQHAPDVAAQLESGEPKITPTYRRLRDEYVVAYVAALDHKPSRGNYALVETREGERFVFKWVKTARSGRSR